MEKVGIISTTGRMSNNDDYIQKNKMEREFNGASE